MFIFSLPKDLQNLFYFRASAHTLAQYAQLCKASLNTVNPHLKYRQSIKQSADNIKNADKVNLALYGDESYKQSIDPNIKAKIVGIDFKPNDIAGKTVNVWDLAGTQQNSIVGVYLKRQQIILLLPRDHKHFLQLAEKARASAPSALLVVLKHPQAEKLELTLDHYMNFQLAGELPITGMTTVNYLSDEILKVMTQPANQPSKLFANARLLETSANSVRNSLTQLVGKNNAIELKTDDEKKQNRKP